MFTSSAAQLGKSDIRRSLEEHLLRATGIEADSAEPQHWLFATAAFARELVLERWARARREKERQGAKEVCYFSMEFLIGRLLMDTLRSLGIHEICSESLADIGCRLEDIAEQEPDPGLGNGGLGRLAACLLDSTAAVGVPAYGYGIRYEFGMFAQRIEGGWQSEEPEQWLRFGGAWEFPRPDLTYPIRFYGQVEGNRWVNTADALATAYDVAVPGYQSDTVNTLRLWQAKAPRELDLRRFNEGDHSGAVGDKAHWESLTRVLYPHDGTLAGRELRFRQQYFFVSASLQDILRRMKRQKRSLHELPDFVAIQINDTHPAIAIPELMRLLMDDNGLDWAEAWDITRRTISYTNHTLMPEALETWPLNFFERMLPRHLQIIYRINEIFLLEVTARHFGDIDLLRRVSFIDEQGERRVRMAHLAFVGSHAVNGVSKIHTDLMRSTVFADFDRLLPGRIMNVTNGIAPRRWLAQVHPQLSALITARIGAGWMRDLGQLERLASCAEDAEFRRAFRACKQASKQRLAAHIAATMGVAVDPAALFDVQVKRIHEYKRQLLKLLHVVALYDRMRRDPGRQQQPRVVIFAGKAAPGYAMAKLIIKLINDVAAMVNNDPAIGGKLKVLFLPNYSVSLAERIIPAADLSEQISTAGTEASGTGNMKLALNGALTIGTLDGANIEIRDAVGAENFFAFGLEADEVAEEKEAGYDPLRYVEHDLELQRVLGLIGGGHFSPGEPDLFRQITDNLTRFGEQYCVLADFRSYCDCQDEVDRLYPQRDEWDRRAILNIAQMGRFSSDRAVLDYADQIWRAKAANRR